jgi:hypothetical protein
MHSGMSINEPAVPTNLFAVRFDLGVVKQNFGGHSGASILYSCGRHAET